MLSPFPGSYNKFIASCSYSGCVGQPRKTSAGLCCGEWFWFAIHPWYPQSTAGTSSRPAAACSLGVRTWGLFCLSVNGAQGQCLLSRHLSTLKMLSLAFSLWSCGSLIFQLEVSYKWGVFAVVSLGRKAVHFLGSFMPKQEKKCWQIIAETKTLKSVTVITTVKNVIVGDQSLVHPLRKIWGRLPFWWRIQGQTKQVSQNHQGVCGIQNWSSHLM